MKCKYVIFNEEGVETPYLLPCDKSHNPFAFRLRKPIISAGLAQHDGKEWNVSGASATLNVKSRPGIDADILNRFYPC